MCSGCGQSLEATWDTGIDIPVVEHTCAGCKAREEHMNKNRDGMGAGVKVALGRVELEAYDPDDEVLPVFE